MVCRLSFPGEQRSAALDMTRAQACRCEGLVRLLCCSLVSWTAIYSCLHHAYMQSTFDMDYMLLLLCG